MDLQDRFPLNEDLRKRARRRMPHFAFEYLDSGTGDDSAHNANHIDLDAVRLMPGVLEGPQEVDLTTELLGREYAMPFGIAPVGMSGVMWPGAEEMLAREAVRSNLPYCMSSMANATPEQLRLQTELRQVSEKLANVDREAARIDQLPVGHRERSPSPDPSAWRKRIM